MEGRQFEVLFAFDKKYLKALEKCQRSGIISVRVDDLMSFLSVQLNAKIWDHIKEEISKRAKSPEEYREIDYEKDIEIWSYPKKIYMSCNNGPIYYNTNTVIAKYYILFSKINFSIFKHENGHNLIDIVRLCIKDIIKESGYNELVLPTDLKGLDVEEFEEVKRIFRYVILQRV